MPSAKPKPLPAASLHLVLALLDGENHGYALMRRVEERAGAVRMGPGTLHGTVDPLLADGLINETETARRTGQHRHPPRGPGRAPSRYGPMRPRQRRGGGR